MAVGAVSTTTPVQPPQPLQQTPAVSATDKDRDEATEGSATKAKEAASGGTSLPVDANRGRNVNISV